MAAMARMLETGRGVQCSEREALRFYQLAAEDGLADPAWRLGMMLAEGRGGPRDDAQAAQLFSSTAGKGDPRGLLSLARFRLAGRGGATDVLQARILLKQAVKAGAAQAAVELSRLFEADCDLVEAWAWARLGESRGHRGARSQRLRLAASLDGAQLEAGALRFAALTGDVHG